MKTLSRRDVFGALVTGLTTGIITWRILLFLDHMVSPFGGASLALVFGVPVLWLMGVQLGYALGVWFRPMMQFGKFAAVGFANTAIDFGVLYLGIALGAPAQGYEYSLLKTASFCVAIVHSYLWNKFWTFDAGANRGGAKEAISFISVSVAALLIDVGIASLVVKAQPALGDPRGWAGIGAAVGSAFSLIISFIGFRIFVFRRK